MSAYLMHHGIKGQKWGVRRFQNEDGSLTGAGESRYNDGEGGFKFGEHASSGGSRNKSVKSSRSNKKVKSKRTPEQKKALAKKIAIAAGATAVAAAGAYIVSRNIKNKANKKLLDTYSQRVSSINKAHKNTLDNIDLGLNLGKKPNKNDYGLANRLYDRTRKNTNMNLGEAKRLYEDQRRKNKSVFKAYKYLKGNGNIF